MRLLQYTEKVNTKKDCIPHYSIIKKILHIKNPYETRDFTNVKFASELILDSCNFDKKKFKNYQIWHVSENKPMMIKEFVREIFKLKKVKKKVKLNTNNIVKFNHISDKKSVWK